MGKIFSSAALSPFLMRFTIHRREQIAACAVTAPRAAQAPELWSLFLTLTEMLWQILDEVTVLKSATLTITRR